MTNFAVQQKFIGMNLTYSTKKYCRPLITCQIVELEDTLTASSVTITPGNSSGTLLINEEVTQIGNQEDWTFFTEE